MFIDAKVGHWALVVILLFVGSSGAYATSKDQLCEALRAKCLFAVGVSAVSCDNLRKLVRV